MRTLLVALAVLGMCAPAAALAHGGGGGVHYVIISVQTHRPGPPMVNRVEMPLEITDAPVSLTEGEMTREQTIALHTLRALGAVVLLEPVEGRKGVIPAGHVLTELTLHDGGTDKPVYCDLYIAPGNSGHYQWDCYSDSQGNGQLDNYWLGRDGDEFLGLSTDASAMDWKRKLAQPAAYRKATPTERPTGLIGYTWCGGDGVTGPPRFTVSASWSGGFFETAEANACNFGTWEDSNAKGSVVIDQIKATFRPGAQAHTLAFKVESRVPPEPIEHLRPNGGIIALASANAESALESEELKEPPFRPAGGPGTTTTGDIRKGAVFYSISVKHSITGILTNEVRTGTYRLLANAAAIPGVGLPSGQAMYGARVGGAIKPQLVWCAPQMSRNGEWSGVVCLPNNGVGNVFVKTAPAMMGAAHITLSDHLPQYVAEPIVERRDVDLPTMVLSYTFAGWDGATAKVEQRLDWGEGPEFLMVRGWPSDSNGDVHVPVLGGEIVIMRKIGNDREASVGAFVANSPEPPKLLQ